MKGWQRAKNWPEAGQTGGTGGRGIKVWTVPATLPLGGRVGAELSNDLHPWELPPIALH